MERSASSEAMSSVLRVIGSGRLIDPTGPYLKVDADGTVLDVYVENVKIAEPYPGQQVFLTHEHGRSGLIVTCCRAPGDPELAEGIPATQATPTKP